MDEFALIKSHVNLNRVNYGIALISDLKVCLLCYWVDCICYCYHIALKWLIYMSFALNDIAYRFRAALFKNSERPSLEK